MPWPIYSERFLHHQGAGSWIYTVPAGKRAIITNVDAINLGQTGSFAALYVGPICALFADLPAYLSRMNQQLRIVAYQGEEVALVLLHSDTHTTVDGYLMEDKSGATGPPGETDSRPHPDPTSLPIP